MAGKFGKNGSDVEQFFDEVSATRDRSRWATVLSGNDPDSNIAAMDAIDEVGLSASVESAIGKVKYSTVAPIGLADDDFPEIARGVRTILGMVGLAAIALSLGSRLPAEHRKNLLGPFVDAGFTSVLVAMPDQDELSGGPGASGAGGR